MKFSIFPFDKLRILSLSKNNFQFSITKILFLVIILIASILRLYQLGNVPISPDWDEAALGYNAYSILHTGRDEYGKFLPVVLQSFNDYKPALYTYITIPFIAIFDLSVFAVRLPSVLFGIATVIATFFLVRELFTSESRSTNHDSRITILALLSSFFLAISPWHIQFSRVAFESNVGLAFNVFAALFFLKGLRKHWVLIISVICADLSLYVYQSEKVFTPLLVLSLIFIYRKQLFVIPKKYLITAFLIGFITLVPMLHFTLTTHNALARAKGVSIFSQSSVYLDRSIQNRLVDTQHHDLAGVLFNSHWIIWMRETLGDYLLHFDPNWLFVRGDISRHHAPGMGLLYLFELPLILIGVYQLIFGSFNKKAKWLIFFWLLIAPVPSAVSIGAPHAVRTLNFLPMFQVFTALGAFTIFNFESRIKNQESRIRNYILVGLVSFVFISNFVYYLNQYFVQQNYFTAPDWQYGYKDAVTYVQQHQQEYQNVIVSSHSPLDQSYIFFLFYLKYPPAQYQRENAQKPLEADHTFSNYIFRSIDWQHESATGKMLYVGSSQDFPSGIHTIKTITYPSGNPAILLVAK